MNFFKNFFNKRNYAQANLQLEKMGQPTWTDFSIQKSVKDGLKSNVWVFRSVNLITQNASSVPWYVAKDGEVIDGHPIGILLNKPNSFISRQSFFEILISWLQLAGNAYIYKNKVNGVITEFLLISPDRIAPITSKNILEWSNGYAVDGKNKKEFDSDEIIHFMSIRDPANPLVGLSPLQAAGKTVDIDNAQRNFNAAAMQNQGILSGVWTFDREFNSQEDSDAISKSLNEKYAGTRNAKKMGVIGSNAKYTRTSLTPTELDFQNSRNANRNEIFIAFGVPPQLGGSEESSTYNNYQASEIIFWATTIVPLLDDIANTFNFALAGQLEEGARIHYDISNVSALRSALLDKTTIAKDLFEMGAPFEQINNMFKFGFSEFDGWNESFVKNSAKTPEATPVRMEKKKILIRSEEDVEKEIMSSSEKYQKDLAKLLKKQQAAIFKDIEENNGVNIMSIIDTYDDDMQKILLEIYTETVKDFAENVAVINNRSLGDTLVGQILGELLKIVGIEAGFIKQTTIDTVYQQVDDGLVKGWSMKEFQQAIIDTGVFSPERALLIARTVTGGAANYGQFKGAEYSGATHKTWQTAQFEVRPSHVKLDNVTIPTNEKFKVGKSKAMFPGESSLPPGEKCNCRCVLSYEIQ